jgi:L-amino acid N-acyltransferase YncA
MIIRKARQEDLPAINEIYNQAVQQRFCTAHLKEVGIREREHWFALHSHDNYPVFVAVTDRRVTGWVSIGPYREGRQALAHVAEVSYYVHELERGKGIGNKLLDHAVRVASDYGFSVLIAILLSRNQASIGLLKKFGFNEWGRMPGIARIDEEQADHLYYGLRL